AAAGNRAPPVGRGGHRADPRARRGSHTGKLAGAARRSTNRDPGARARRAPVPGHRFRVGHLRDRGAYAGQPWPGVAARTTQEREMSEDFISGLHADLVEAMDRYERRSPRGRLAAGRFPRLLRPATLARLAAGAPRILAPLPGALPRGGACV